MVSHDEAYAGSADQGRDAELPIDPDVREEQLARDHRRPQRALRDRGDILLAIALGGAVGSVARWGVARALWSQSADFAWGTVAANLSGAFLLGLLMIFVVDVWATTRLVRPFLGVGVLGGYTTFSTYMLDARSLISDGQVVLAGIYLLTTLVGGVLAVWIGIVTGRAAISWRRRTKAHDDIDPTIHTGSSIRADSRSKR